ncbi:MAG: VOC family protein [Candidatus Eremiobacteraeota bacterium]|nr:VOC family protein [Candidatus Eremiobacteraeota bacterium]
MVTLVCADLGRSREFYRNVMGLTAIADRSPDWIEFDLGAGVALRLHPKSELLRVRPGSLQLGFTVENVDRFVANCTARGIPVFEDPYDEPSGRVAVIGDPDGYPIQVGTTGSLAQ